MSKIEKLPVSYSFGFRKEFNGLVDGPKKNMFQFKINHAFARFIKQSADTLFTQCWFNEEASKNFKGLLLENVTFGDFTSFNATNGDESIYVMFVVPERIHNFQDYLVKQISDLEMFFKFLHVSSYVFIESEAGKEWRKVSIGDQPVLPVFVGREGEYNLSFEVQGELLRKLQRLLWIANNPANEEVTDSINSILEYNCSLLEYTHVKLCHDYLEIQIFGEQCSLVGIFSEEKIILMAKHIDCAPQMMALFAAVGCLFDLAENQK